MSGYYLVGVVGGVRVLVLEFVFETPKGVKYSIGLVGTAAAAHHDALPLRLDVGTSEYIGVRRLAQHRIFRISLLVSMGENHACNHRPHRY